VIYQYHTEIKLVKQDEKPSDVKVKRRESRKEGNQERKVKGRRIDYFAEAEVEAEHGKPWTTILISIR